MSTRVCRHLDQAARGCVHVQKASVAWHDSSACVPWLKYTRVTTHLYVGHDSGCKELCCNAMKHMLRDMALSHVCHDSCACVPWLRLQGAVLRVHEASVAWLEFLANVLCLICKVPWFVCICAMMQAIRRRDTDVESIWCVTWSIFMCAMTHFHECRDSFTCAPWLICMCATTHLHVWCKLHGVVSQVQRSSAAWHDSFSIVCVLWFNCMCAMSRTARKCREFTKCRKDSKYFDL